MHRRGDLERSWTLFHFGVAVFERRQAGPSILVFPASVPLYCAFPCCKRGLLPRVTHPFWGVLVEC